MDAENLQRRKTNEALISQSARQSSRMALQCKGCALGRQNPQLCPSDKQLEIVQNVVSGFEKQLAFLKYSLYPRFEKVGLMTVHIPHRNI